METGIVYCHSNKINGKVYVGQTWQPRTKRWNRHVHDALHGESGCRYFHAAIRKYGPEIFEHKILSYARTQEQLDNLEKVWQILLRARNREFGYNLREGGSGGRMAEETKNKFFIGHSVSEQTRQQIRTSLIGKSSWNKGKHCSEATKHKISIAHLGKSLSEETRQKMSDSQKGRPQAINTYQALLGNKRAAGHVGFWKGKHISNEMKQKISETRKQRFASGAIVPWNKTVTEQCA